MLVKISFEANEWEEILNNLNPFEVSIIKATTPEWLRIEIKPNSMRQNSLENVEIHTK